ncbi:hypothetical protein FLL67_15475 [Vibrio cholerae]|nr:hypothetical protein [Vibrio cholerae]TQQ26885.1 hypothetical protein FLL67_15475 [Vibrio cholerae]HDL9469088.1 hypothetical protein [Vibrio cholerae]
MVKVLCSNFCIACLRPLTRRYVLWRNSWKLLLLKNIHLNIQILFI